MRKKRGGPSRLPLIGKGSDDMLQRLDSIYFKVSFIKQGTEETIELLDYMVEV